MTLLLHHTRLTMYKSSVVSLFLWGLSRLLGGPLHSSLVANFSQDICPHEQDLFMGAQDLEWVA